MHLLLLTLASLFTVGAPPAERPVPFTDVLYGRYYPEFYDQQAAAWEAVATDDCGTDLDWWHYYKTAHYSNRFGNGEYDLAAILAAAEQRLDPEGFEMHYLRFAADKNPATRFEHLVNAQRADPDRPEAAPALATYYSINGRTKEQNDVLALMHRHRPLPAGLLEYNHNQLMSVARNGILITQGDSDTYPAWLLQGRYGVRPDVAVINLPLLLGISSYRSYWEQQLGLAQPLDVAGRDVAAVLAQLAGQARPLYFSATGQHHFAQLPAERMFVTGLAFRYSPTPVDNLGELARNVSERFRTELLRQPFDDSPAQAVADQLNQNYLPALLELHEYYQEHPDPALRDNLRLIRTIAARSGRTAAVDEVLRGNLPPERLASAEPGVRAREILKNTAYVPAGSLQRRDGRPSPTITGFSMQTTEVSNADYHRFLEDLLRQRRFDLIDSVAPAPIDFAEFFPNGYTEPLTKAVNAGHPAYDDYPVVNVSHRAAELYARWLTEAYNQDPKRKDGRNVRFRLPTAEEFEYAFRGGRNFAPYPWGGPYFRNAKGCFLANFDAVRSVTVRDIFSRADPSSAPTAEQLARVKAYNDEQDRNCDGTTNDAVDGGMFTVAVESYFPNDFGLYNMAGNAAEMLARPDRTMGGSWADPAYHMQAGVMTERKLPHPSTGFRLVMTYE